MTSTLKETLKMCKSIKKSDEILDDLFNSIKKEKESSGSEAESEIEEDSDESSQSNDRKRSKKKKKKKHKKKKKRHKRNDHSEERCEAYRKKTKVESNEDSFWGESKPYNKSPIKGEFEVSRGKVSRLIEKEDPSRIQDKREIYARDEYNSSRERYNRERSDHGYSDYYESRRHKPEYQDERRPVDLGRVARPFPTDLERSRSDYDDLHRSYTGRRGRNYSEHYEREYRYRHSYDRENWVREEYDRYSVKEDRRLRRDRDDYNRVKERARESYARVKEVERRNDISKDKESDTFWDSKWEGMQLDEKLEKAEAKGRYYLNTKKRFKDATGDKEGTPSLSPSPKRDGKVSKVISDSESDTEELKRLKKLKDIQNLKVDGDGLIKGPVADSANYEYDNVTRMFKKKDGLVELEKKLYDEDTEKSSEEKLEGDFPINETVSSSKGLNDKETDDGVMDELVKEIEELENEVDRKEADLNLTSTETNTTIIDWNDSALAHLKEEKESNLKKKHILEDGEVDEDKEDGEVNSEDEKGKSNRNRYRSSSRKRSRSKRRSYSRGRERSRYERSSRRRSYSGYRYSRSRDRQHSRCEKSRSPHERYSRRRYSRSSSYENRKYSRRSRSREKSAENRYERNKRRQEKHIRSKINKTKLLEIAKKNAAKILKSGGDFMGMDQDRLISMKSGGSSLDELTKFCKEIAKKGLEDSTKIDLLAESESSSDEEFHHPFMVKDRPLPNPITMLIGEARETLPPAARAVAKSQRMLEFPVSSGNAHRSKEALLAAEGKDPLGEWQPVEKKAIEMKADEDEMVKFHEQIEKEEKELAESAEARMNEESNKPWTLADEDKDIAVPKSDIFKAPLKELSPVVEKELEKLKPKTLGNPLTTVTPPLALAGPSVPDPAISSDPEKVFDTPSAPVVDIGTIVSTRLNAMRKLQANPTDAEALQEMYLAQQQMTNWASSKNKPGQFVGSTGAKILSKHELNLGLQCWAKPEQFTKAERVKGGFGEFMLKKMGWNDGEGLGKNKSGDVNPLTLDIKFDKKGLMAAEEGPKRTGGVVTMTACKDLSGKHPISALTELCSKRRWGPPIFTQAFECGPPHKKQYVFKVNVNGQDYQPTVAVDNKKKAKANAAMAALQQMGLVPKDPDNPV